MNQIQLSSPFFGGVTIIPNQFITHHMLHANGEFVKIYLYLMHLSEQHTEFSLSQIADVMDCTESDVRRALRYWEKEGLMKVLPPNSRKMQSLIFTMPPAEAARPQTVLPNEHDTVSEQVSLPVSEPQIAVAQAAAAQQRPEPTVYKPLTTAKVKQLKENEAIAELLFIAQQYLKKTLSPTETNKILFFYEELQFSPDLIEYLIEYCVGKGHKSMNYIEKVAFAWKEEGYHTVDDAKKASEGYHKDYYTILKALGIRGRDPIDAEIQIMKVWLSEYGFTTDLITEACTRTILATKQPSLAYTDGILKAWKEAQVHTLSDIKKLDLAHEQSKTEKTASKPKKTGKNRFSNFEQRDYDYDSLESQLLNN